MCHTKYEQLRRHVFIHQHAAFAHFREKGRKLTTKRHGSRQYRRHTPVQLWNSVSRNEDTVVSRRKSLKSLVYHAPFLECLPLCKRCRLYTQSLPPRGQTFPRTWRPQALQSHQPTEACFWSLAFAAHTHTHTKLHLLAITLCPAC